MQPKNKPPQAVPSTYEVTNVQISNALLIIQSLYPYLAPAAIASGEPNKEAIDSAETTFINACGVLDKILDEKKRWTCDAADALAVALEQLYLTQSELNTVSTAAVTQVHRPSFLLKPDLKERKPGEWVAQYGKSKNALKGIGATPHQAMLAFDMTYYNLTQESPNEQQ